MTRRQFMRYARIVSGIALLLTLVGAATAAAARPAQPLTPVVPSGERRHLLKELAEELRERALMLHIHRR